jgi:hypothetical protein
MSKQPPKGPAFPDLALLQEKTAIFDRLLDEYLNIHWLLEDVDDDLPEKHVVDAREKQAGHTLDECLERFSNLTQVEFDRFVLTHPPPRRKQCLVSIADARRP